MALTFPAPMLEIDRFYSGLWTNRNILTPPIRIFGRRIIQLFDALAAGQNMEISTKLTLRRRPGYLTFNSNALAGIPQKFYTFQPPNQVFPIIDTTTNVYQVNPGSGAPTSLITKSQSQQSSFKYIGNYLYIGNQEFKNKVDQNLIVTNWGIAIGSINNSIGPNTTGNGVNDATGGTVNWTNPNNVTSAVSYATAVLTGGQNTFFDDCSQFAFNIPATNTILGIQITATSYGTDPVNGAMSLKFLMRKAGNFVGNPEVVTLSQTPGSTVTAGGPSDLWGVNWTPNDINQATFGVGILANDSMAIGSGGTANLRNVRITIFSAGGPGIVVSASAGTFSAVQGYNYVFAYGSSNDLSLSNPTPPSITTGVFTNKLNVQVSLTASTDAQVNQIRLFRTTDGIGSVFFESPNSPFPNIGWAFTSVANAAAGSTVYTGTPIGASGFASSVGQSFLVAGFTNAANNGTFICTAATATTLTLSNAGGVAETHAATGTLVALDNAADSSLVTSQQVTSPSVNWTPPPTGLQLMEWYAGRLWGAVNNLLYFAAGPDLLPGVGNGNTAWPPGNVFVLPTTITKLVAMPFGMLVFTLDDVHIVQGIQNPGFTVNRWIAGLGVRTQNCVDTDGSNIYAYTSDQQFLNINANGIEQVGLNIGDSLDTLNATAVYVAVHRAGSQDNHVFVSDGSANVYPYNVTQGTWEPKQIPAAGNNAIGSIEISPGVHKFLLGLATAGGNILQRDLNTFTDNGTTYAANCQFGSIPVADPGQLAIVRSIVLKMTSATTLPNVFILPNEISGAGTQLNVSTAPLDVPTDYAGTAFASSTYQAKEYLTETANIAEGMMHFQFNVAFGANTTPDELLAWAIYGPQPPFEQQVPQLPQPQGR